MEKTGWNKTFLIDGFPRGMENYNVWEKNLGELVDFQFAIQLDCSIDTMVKRVIERSKSSGRFDDDPEVLKKRLKTHEETSQPILDQYQKRGKLVRINVEKSIEEVYKEIQKLFLKK
eukprot:TRINITY_DN15896_c0_g1_i1.p1 TRINITY_DN15896_c0_g1~~TRINITY_DN15896_c0_g1_i1.p1  ORF type:complete len:117 (-),score=24.91 TRINITY_DN15896_c0_g1_i1:49-399(-)